MTRTPEQYEAIIQNLSAQIITAQQHNARLVEENESLHAQLDAKPTEVHHHHHHTSRKEYDLALPGQTFRRKKQQ